MQVSQMSGMSEALKIALSALPESKYSLPAKQS